MKKQSDARFYNFSDSELYTWTLDRLRLSERDAEKLLPLGFTDSKRKQLLELAQAFGQLPDDDELLGEQMTATDHKNKAREALLSAIRLVMHYVKQVYSPREGRYRKFGTSKMGNMSEHQLLFCGLRVARVAEKHLEVLQQTGLNQHHIDAVRQTVKGLENSMHVQQDRVSDRDISVEKRVDLGNRLYKSFIELCELGKMAWADGLKVHYDEYCVYEPNTEQKRQKREEEKQQKEEAPARKAGTQRRKKREAQAQKEELGED